MEEVIDPEELAKGERAIKRLARNSAWYKRMPQKFIRSIAVVHL